MRLTDEPELIADISYFLGIVYRNVNWAKIQKARATSHDIFQKRLRVAAMKTSIPELLSKLCGGLRLEAPSIHAELIERLDYHSRTVLNMIRKWTQYFVYRSSDVAEALKEKKSYEEIKGEIIKSILQEED
jgi:hypothetical protein